MELFLSCYSVSKYICRVLLSCYSVCKLQKVAADAKEWDGPSTECAAPVSLSGALEFLAFCNRTIVATNQPLQPFRV
jgi:hypothetical protein